MIICPSEVLSLLSIAVLSPWVALAQEVPEYPPFGDLVDVSGYRLHLHCTGEGGPTVPRKLGRRIVPGEIALAERPDPRAVWISESRRARSLIDGHGHDIRLDPADGKRQGNSFA